VIGLRKAVYGAKINKGYSIFTNQLPNTPNKTDGAGSLGDYELGLKFQSFSPGWITAIRHYKSPSETGSHVGNVWTQTGALLGSVNFANESAEGWQSQKLADPLSILANTTYVVSVNCNQFFPITLDALIKSLANEKLLTVADGLNGFYNNTPGGFPDTSFSSSNYFRDIVFIEA
jgi:hypothetical protein